MTNHSDNGGYDVDPTRDSAEFLATPDQLERIFITAATNIIKSPYAAVIERPTVRHATIQLEIPAEFFAGFSEWNEYQRAVATCDVETAGQNSGLPRYTELDPGYDEEYGESPIVSLVSMKFERDFDAPGGQVTLAKDLQFFKQEDGTLEVDITHETTGAGVPRGRGEEMLLALMESQELGLHESLSGTEAEQLIELADLIEYIR